MEKNKVIRVLLYMQRLCGLALLKKEVGVQYKAKQRGGWRMQKIQIENEWDAKAFGILLQHGIVRAVLPIDPPTYIVFDEQIEKLKDAGIPFTVLGEKGEKHATQRKGV